MGNFTVKGDMESLCLGILSHLKGAMDTIDVEHWKDTPSRMAKHYEAMFWGAAHDPGDVLKTFEETEADQIILVEGIEYVSWCSHHLLPFMGTVDFAYIPDGRIVGLSKIPRMVQILAARPQVQERLTQQIAGAFQEVVKPKGVAVLMKGAHTCMMARGVEQRAARMKTSVMLGAFRDKEAARNEFFSMVSK